MTVDRQGNHSVGKAPTTVERISDTELVVTRTVKGAVEIVFEAWTTPDLFRRWWAPRSSGVSMISFDADMRSGGTYRAVLKHPSSEGPMTFFGRYLEVVPPSRLVWTNEEGGEGGAVTTVTFEEQGGATKVVVHERYPSKALLDEALASGSTSGWGEQFEQLDGLLLELTATG